MWYVRRFFIRAGMKGESPILSEVSKIKLNSNSAQNKIDFIRIYLLFSSIQKALINAFLIGQLK